MKWKKANDSRANTWAQTRYKTKNESTKFLFGSEPHVSNLPYKTFAYQFNPLKASIGRHGDQCVKTSGGQHFPVPSLHCSLEDLRQHGLLRQQEDQTQAEEVPDPPSHPAGRQRQGIHQRYQRAARST